MATKILICTGIYPPDIGGPAQYAKHLFDEFTHNGHRAKVLVYGLEKKLPPVFSHYFYFLRALFHIYKTDLIVALDTFSVAWPAVCVAKLFGKKIIIRTGGDFLWESYVERTGKLVLFRDFYEKEKGSFNLREKVIFAITKWLLINASAIVFSTKWQKGIWQKAYELKQDRLFIIENFYGSKTGSLAPDKKVFVGGTRVLKWKNILMLKEAFEEAKKKEIDIELDLANAPYDEFINKIANSYAIILVSLGDISPNMILDALRVNKPFILTRETGLYEKLKDVGVFVDPLDKEDIKNKILFLTDDKNYAEYKKRVENFNFTHLWPAIVQDFLEVYKKLGQ